LFWIAKHVIDFCSLHPEHGLPLMNDVLAAIAFHHHQITKLSHSINAIGPTPHRGGRNIAFVLWLDWWHDVEAFIA
jgi:hypothetical protein